MLKALETEAEALQKIHLKIQRQIQNLEVISKQHALELPCRVACSMHATCMHLEHSHGPGMAAEKAFWMPSNITPYRCLDQCFGQYIYGPFQHVHPCCHAG